MQQKDSTHDTKKMTSLDSTDVDDVGQVFVLAMECGIHNVVLETHQTRPLAEAAAAHLWCSWVLYSKCASQLQELDSGGLGFAHQTIRHTVPESLAATDRIAQLEAALAEAEQQAKQLARASEEQLRRDMQSFCESQPQATFIDFVRRHSPSDVKEGELSARFRKSDNRWSVLWRETTGETATDTSFDTATATSSGGYSLLRNRLNAMHTHAARRSRRDDRTHMQL